MKEALKCIERMEKGIKSREYKELKEWLKRRQR